jgi:hypothetical protein
MKKNLKSKISSQIKRSSRDVFLRSDFKNLAGYDQVGRELRLLVKDGVLIKIGYGLYAKARENNITHQVMVAAPGGFKQVATEALKRLKVNFSSSEADKNYQQGSTQIPANAEVMVFDRFNRNIFTTNQQLKIVKR